MVAFTIFCYQTASFRSVGRKSRYRRHRVRAAPLITILYLITLVGCASQVSMARTSTASKPVFRAASDGLTELESAAHAPRRDDDDKKRKERKNSGSRCGTCNNSPCTCSDQGSFTGQMALNVITSPFTVPAALIGDDYDHVTHFPDYPYADGLPGSLLINSEFKGKKQTLTGNLQTFAIPGSSDLDRFGGRLLLENPDRIGIDTGAYATGRLTCLVLSGRQRKFLQT
jgi:hypothetical protein